MERAENKAKEEQEVTKRKVKIKRLRIIKYQKCLLHLGTFGRESHTNNQSKTLFTISQGRKSFPPKQPLTLSLARFATSQMTRQRIVTMEKNER